MHQTTASCLLPSHGRFGGGRQLAVRRALLASSARHRKGARRAACASPSPVLATAQTWPCSCTWPSRARSVAPASATRSHSTARPRASRPSHSSTPPTQQGSCATSDASRDGRCASTTVDTTRPASTWACFLTIRAARAAALGAELHRLVPRLLVGSQPHDARKAQLLRYWCRKRVKELELHLVRIDVRHVVVVRKGLPLHRERPVPVLVVHAARELDGTPRNGHAAARPASPTARRRRSCSAPSPRPASGRCPRPRGSPAGRSRTWTASPPRR